MNARSRYLPAAFALVTILMLAACGSSDTTESGSETSTSAAASVEADDDRSPDQVAMDELDVTMYQLGVRDLPTVGDCVVERMESEGFSLAEDEAAELAALIGCEPAVSTALFADRSASFGAEPWACATDELAKWIGTLPLSDAQSFFEAALPPADLVTLVADTCGVAESDFLAVFG